MDPSPSLDLDLLNEWLPPDPSFNLNPAQQAIASNIQANVSGASRDDQQSQPAPGRKRSLQQGSSGKAPEQLDAQRKWRLKEKNRVKDLEAELQQKIAQANELAATNAALRRKQSMLEAVLVVREDQLRTLGKEAPVAGLPSTTPYTLASSQVPADASRLALPHSSSAVAQPPASLNSSAVLLQEQQEEVPAPPGFDQPLPSLKHIPAHTSWNEAWIQRLRRTTPQEWQALWLEFIKESSMLAISADAHGPGSHAHDCLSKVVSRYLGIVDYITLLNPSVYYDSLYVNLSTGQAEHPPASHWATVARAVSPTPSQLRDCATALASFDECMSKVLAERAALAAKIDPAAGTSITQALGAASTPVPITQGTCFRGMLDQPGGQSGLEQFNTAEIQQLQQATYGAHGQPGFSGFGQLVQAAAHQQAGGSGGSGAVQARMSSGDTGTIQTSDLSQLTRLLSLNLAKEHAAHSTISDYLCTRVLSVVQLARSAAVSWPWMPDVTAILKAGMSVWEKELDKPG